MPKPNRGERRKQILKQRRAEEQHDFDRTEAEFIYRSALYEHEENEDDHARRLLTKALHLDPNHAAALSLLAQIHDEAGRYEEGLACVLRLRKLRDDATDLYNLGILYQHNGQPEKAAEAIREFLRTTKNSSARMRKLRQSAAAFSQSLPIHSQPEQPPPPAPPPPTPAAVVLPRSPAPEQPPPPPRVHVQFLPSSRPSFAAPGTLDDYFLRRRWTELRMAQNFEDLLCLPSLHGVDTYVYQQETVRRVLRQFKGRALLADEVGLGKTIEACLVLKEYWMRGLVRKALVLTPPSLVSQWKGELTEKFRLEPFSPDGAAFRNDPPSFWKQTPLVVASVAMARMEAHAAAVAAVPWDMVIVDEAHCLKNRTSANWRLVDSLQKKFVLMLTATPVENNLLELYNLITLLKPGLLATEADFRKVYMTPGKPKSPKNPEQLRTLLADVMIRNTRAAADVQLPRRIAATVLVHPSETEAQLYDMVSRFVSHRYRPAERTMALDLMQRQAGSSPQAVGRSAARALREHDGYKAEDRRELEGILDLAGSINWSDKGAKLAEMLTARPGKAVVFTEFLPTLDHLQRVCQEHGISYSLFSGELSRAEKDAAIARFRDQTQVLLSTASGGEGRNLQFADTIVNFDLPWNPMRIEQRIGRVHRIGQDRDVFVFNFCQEGTVEEQLLRVLHDKINMFELVIGEMDAILGTLDDQRDFADIVMDLWLSGRESGQVEQAFEDLATRLIDAKKEHVKVQELDDSLFARDFEV